LKLIFGKPSFYANRHHGPSFLELSATSRVSVASGREITEKMLLMWSVVISSVELA